MLPSEYLPKPICYYDPHRRDYLVENSRNGFVRINETNVKRYLREAGVSTKGLDGDLLSPVERELLRIQRERDVDYAGPLAGYEKGLAEIQGRRILVTDSFRLVAPVMKPFPTIESVLQNLFGDQLPYFLGWLKCAYESLRDRRRTPGQAMCVAGPKDGGKSLAQSLITATLGGRSAKPYLFMSGQTAFNWDLFGAEHLMIEDDIASTDIRRRRDFGSQIKSITVNEVQSCHGKNRDAVALTPFWRISVTLNDEPEHMMILPPLDESLTDKVILLKAAKHPMPMDTSTNEGRAAFWAVLMNELPGFILHLTTFKIPIELKSQRFGVTHYHHPELLDALNELSPEHKLLGLVDSLDLFNCATSWRGTAEELKHLLLDSPRTRSDAQQLLNWQNAIGTYLGRLASKRPDRISPIRENRQRAWVIHGEVL
jgi:hypothetical protein